MRRNVYAIVTSLAESRDRYRLAELERKATQKKYVLLEKSRRPLSIREVRRIRADEPRSQVAKVVTDFEPRTWLGMIVFRLSNWLEGRM